MATVVNSILFVIAISSEFIGRSFISLEVWPWQRRYWEHTIRDDSDFAARMDYTHFNPFKHSLVTHPADWAHSSFHRCNASGIYPTDWRGGSDELRQTGERL